MDDGSGMSNAATNARVAYSDRSRRTREGTPGLERSMLSITSMTAPWYYKSVATLHDISAGADLHRREVVYIRSKVRRFRVRQDSCVM